LSTWARALILFAAAGFIASCGPTRAGPGETGEPQLVLITGEEADKLIEQRYENVARLLASKGAGATPIMNIQGLRINEDPQGESAPYPGREAASVRFEELDMIELIKLFGKSYIRTERIMTAGRPYDWVKLEAGGSPTDMVDRITRGMIERERRDGGRRGKTFGKHLVLLRRNAERVRHASLIHGAGLLERDFKRLTVNCGYFPKEIAETLQGVGAVLEEDLVAEKPAEEAPIPDGAKKEGGKSDEIEAEIEKPAAKQP